MTIFQRIRRVVIGLIMLGVGIAFIAEPSDEAYLIVIAILTIGLTIKGIKDIIFYFMMAKHMVGGKIILFQGVVVLDFALFTGSLTDVPRIYVLIYLIFIHAFSGVVETLRAMESRRTVDGPWKLKFCHGIVDFLLALACFVFIKRPNTALTIYGAGLIYSAIIRIISAFRRTSFIVIQ